MIVVRVLHGMVKRQVAKIDAFLSHGSIRIFQMFLKLEKFFVFCIKRDINVDVSRIRFDNMWTTYGTTHLPFKTVLIQPIDERLTVYKALPRLCIFVKFM